MILKILLVCWDLVKNWFSGLHILSQTIVGGLIVALIWSILGLLIGGFISKYSPIKRFIKFLQYIFFNIYKFIRHILSFRINFQKYEYYYVEMTKDLEINDFKLDGFIGTLQKGHVYKIGKKLCNSIIKGKYGKEINRKDLVLVQLKPKAEFKYNSIFIYFMKYKRLTNGELPIIFGDGGSYLYKSEYDKNKEKLDEILDEDLLK